MTDPRHGWSVSLGRDPAAVLAAMRDADRQLHDQLVLSLRSLALEAGSAADAGKLPPGDEIDPGRYGLDVPHTPFLISYACYPSEIRIIDPVWLG